MTKPQPRRDAAREKRRVACYAVTLGTCTVFMSELAAELRMSTMTVYESFYCSELVMAMVHA